MKQGWGTGPIKESDVAKSLGVNAVRSVKSAERVFDLLEMIGTKREGTSFGQLNKELGIPKSSLHSLLDVLVARGYIELDPIRRRYVLGIRVWEAGQAYQRNHNVIDTARSVLEAIVGRVNETAQLARLAGRENVYLSKVDSTHVLRLQSDVGARLPAHATGIGKALLAELGDEEIRSLYGTGTLPTFTPSTIATVPALLEELAVIRRRGFAIDNEEYTPGVFCLAVVVYDTPDRATTALSVSVPVTRLVASDLPRILAAIAKGSLQISARTGGWSADQGLTALSDPAWAARAITEMLDSGRYHFDFPSVEATSA